MVTVLQKNLNFVQFEMDLVQTSRLRNQREIASWAIDFAVARDPSRLASLVKRKVTRPRKRMEKGFREKGERMETKTKKGQPI